MCKQLWEYLREGAEQRDLDKPPRVLVERAAAYFQWKQEMAKMLLVRSL